MLRDDTSLVKVRIKSVSETMPRLASLHVMPHAADGR
jgi:hypothetical protein